jgi:hypothetical protein
MNLLRDCWRRIWLWLFNYFADMEPCDRATALIALGLSFAIAFSFAGIVRSREPAPAPMPAFDLAADRAVT